MWKKYKSGIRLTATVWMRIYGGSAVWRLAPRFGKEDSGLSGIRKSGCGDDDMGTDGNVRRL